MNGVHTSDVRERTQGIEEKISTKPWIPIINSAVVCVLSASGQEERDKE